MMGGILLVTLATLKVCILLNQFGIWQDNMMVKN